MNRLLVTRCVCLSRSFTEIKEIVLKDGIDSVEELQAKELCCTKCQMCKPYVELMLNTGKTEFEPGEYMNTG